MARAGRCPNCGEPVSAFAAGCAICGTDLEAHRARAASRRRVSLPWVSIGDRTWWMGVLVLLALFAPVFGFLLAAWTAYDRGSDVPLRNVAWGAGAVAVVLLLTPSVRFGVWQLLVG
jgi:hypothetical protein